MTYYLYIPITEKNVSSSLQNTIENWVKVEKEAKNKDVVVIYKGKKGLNNLPPYAKVYVLAPGTAAEPNPVERQINYETARAHKSTSGQFELREGKDQCLSVPDIVNDIIADGLFSPNEEGAPKKIHIKLFFQNAGKQASRLAEVFKYFLDLNKPASPTNVRIDYYPDSHLLAPRRKEDPHKYAIRESKSGFFRAKELRKSFISDDCQPSLSREAVEAAVASYRSYKASRLCGLSHILGLDSWFSSLESTETIDELLNSANDEERFNIAKSYVKTFPNRKLAECLQEIVDNSVKTYWSPSPAQI